MILILNTSGKDLEFVLDDRIQFEGSKPIKIKSDDLDKENEKLSIKIFS